MVSSGDRQPCRDSSPVTRLGSIHSCLAPVKYEFCSSESEARLIEKQPFSFHPCEFFFYPWICKRDEHAAV